MDPDPLPKAPAPTETWEFYFDQAQGYETVTYILSPAQFHSDNDGLPINRIDLNSGKL